MKILYSRDQSSSFSRMAKHDSPVCGETVEVNSLELEVCAEAEGIAKKTYRKERYFICKVGRRL